MSIQLRTLLVNNLIGRRLPFRLREHFDCYDITLYRPVHVFPSYK